MIIYIKKGAMFGLDARIALAIFGALSVISGASLYSAIQDSKDTAVINQIQEVEKAIIAHYIDNQYNPLSTSFWPSRDLVENYQSLTTWNGPYISGSYHNDYLTLPNIGDVSPLRYNEGFTYNCNTSFGSGKPFYIMFDNNNDDSSTSRGHCNGDLSYAKRMHDKYDSDGDYTSGSFIVVEHGSDATLGSIGMKIDVLK